MAVESVGLTDLAAIAILGGHWLAAQDNSDYHRLPEMEGLYMGHGRLGKGPLGQSPRRVGKQ
ncbi:hypothetical protein N7462_003326 [Penicillium macrosclerotiorum]|uniref:uncharacterized protein n=1 Tax=Penicillium macrosclerotiorum TaxID=303699 RepID=UPI002547239D|nr:uncharacterized protein N7462_003326 [Penicillium macrosclerotiorum]KAJ5688934.1 hypothetical protein N7462_003326 [Penicillium macrosclerotiorum]